MEDAAPGFNTLIARPARFLAQHQQTIKWIVYSLLLLNFSYYVFFEWRSAQTLLSDDASFLEIASVYTTTFDELGWFVLLFIFEYETYWMDDNNYNKILYGLLQVVGLVCYVLISHTLYAYIVDLMALGDAVILDNVTGLCGFVGEDISFLNNLYYTLIDANNCAALARDDVIYKLTEASVVTDGGGYAQAVNHAWDSVIEAACWLIIMVSYSFVVLLQNRGVYKSRWISGADTLQLVCYGLIICCALYWSLHGHYIYTWDSLLWIGGFAAIDANLSEWRHDMEDEAAAV